MEDGRVGNSESNPFADHRDTNAPVRGFVHEPATPARDGLVLTHGAGANCQAPLLVVLAEAFCESGVLVLRCDLPFRQERPHGPPIRTAEKDQQGLRRAAACVREMGVERVFLGGHSYGGRQASMLAAADPGVAEGLLLLSYPLHPPKKPEQLRTAHFSNLRTDVLFVSGSRDGFGTTEELGAALKRIPARTRLVTVASAGHELMTKRNREELPGLVLSEFRAMFPA